MLFSLQFCHHALVSLDYGRFLAQKIILYFQIQILTPEKFSHLLSFVFFPVGRLIYRLVKDALDEMEREDKKEEKDEGR